MFIMSWNENFSSFFDIFLSMQKDCINGAYLCIGIS